MPLGQRSGVASGAGPACAGAWIALGSALLARGRTRRARSVLRRALRRDPNAPRAHELLARASLRLRRRADALRHLRAWLQADPQSAEAHADLGALLSVRGERES